MIVANNTVRVWKEGVPKHWQVLPLKYAVTYNDEKLSDQTDATYEFDYVDIGSVTYGKGIEAYQHMTFAEAPSRARRIVRSKDVILSTVRTYLKATAKIEEHENDIIVSTGFMTMRARKGIILPELLGYLVQSDGLVSEIECQSYGVGYPAINAGEVANLSVPLPPLPEQHAIVRYLDAKCSTVDEAIERHKKIIEKLEEYKRSYIIKAVSGAFISTEFRNSMIPWMPRIPNSWKELPLKYLFGERKHKNTGMIEDNLLSLSYGRIKRKNIETNEGLLPESFEGYNIVEKGDIVLRLTDLQNDKKSLRTGLVTERGIVTSAYVTLCPHGNNNSVYYRYLLHSYDLRKVFYTLGEGIRQSLKYDDIAKYFMLPIPSAEEQNMICEDINSVEQIVDQSIERQNKAIDKLIEYKKSLIYHAVTGKIDCRENN